MLALLTPHSVLALPLILLAVWSGGEVEKPGCTSSPSVSCALCSPAVAQAGQGWPAKLISLLKAWCSTACCRCELKPSPCDANCFSNIPLRRCAGSLKHSWLLVMSQHHTPKCCCGSTMAAFAILCHTEKFKHCMEMGKKCFLCHSLKYACLV